MQVETAVAGADIEFMALDDGDDRGPRAVESNIETAARAVVWTKPSARPPIDSVAGPSP